MILMLSSFSLFSQVKELHVKGTYITTSEYSCKGISESGRYMYVEHPNSSGWHSFSIIDLETGNTVAIIDKLKNDKEGYDMSMFYACFSNDDKYFITYCDYYDNSYASEIVFWDFRNETVGKRTVLGIDKNLNRYPKKFFLTDDSTMIVLPLTNTSDMESKALYSLNLNSGKMNWIVNSDSSIIDVEYDGANKQIITLNLYGILQFRDYNGNLKKSKQLDLLGRYLSYHSDLKIIEKYNRMMISNFLLSNSILIYKYDSFEPDSIITNLTALSRGCLSFSEDMNRFAYITSSSKISILTTNNLLDNKLLDIPSDYNSMQYCFIDFDGKVVFCSDTLAGRIDPITKETELLTFPHGEGRALKFLNKSDKFLLNIRNGYETNRIMLVDAESGNVLAQRIFDINEDIYNIYNINWMDISYDDKYMIFPLMHNKIAVLSLPDLGLVREIDIHDSLVLDAHFFGDTYRIITSSYDSTVKVCDIENPTDIKSYYTGRNNYYADFINDNELFIMYNLHQDEGIRYVTAGLSKYSIVEDSLESLHLFGTTIDIKRQPPFCFDRFTKKLYYHGCNYYEFCHDFYKDTSEIIRENNPTNSSLSLSKDRKYLLINSVEKPVTVFDLGNGVELLTVSHYLSDTAAYDYWLMPTSDMSYDNKYLAITTYDGFVMVYDISGETGLGESGSPVTCGVTAFPNPVSGDRLSLKFDESSLGKRVSIAVTGLGGEEAGRMEIPSLETVNLELPLSGQLRQGAYFITVTINDKSQTIKMLKIKE